ncbi:MAG: DNA polymerase III subunit gamma/tau [Rickettsiales bacterium]
MEYRVLARKYRPTNFDDMIGQEVLVRTLSNAIKSRRIAHAFLLTGIRGIGKTTTARIIARALNCIGEDGKGGATIKPCGVCSNCRMIAEDRHIDVLEMDAASHTGVDAIRELIDTVRYLPTTARYKIYIIDEVHMLSNNAFNALLKTLEEPPPHVKFIFATTESRKIPVTILSRCQRFDLRRINSQELEKHLANILVKEEVEAEEEALKLIADAAEGSVRDSLSLLDQAIARSAEDDGKVDIKAETVRKMIGAADHSAGFRLLEKLLSGDTPSALADIEEQYKAGLDPLMITQDILRLIHLITRVKVAPDIFSDVSLSEYDRNMARKMAESLSMPVLTRLWQMFLKGIGEVKNAPSPLSALEMLLVRVVYAAQMPTPAEIIRDMKDDELSAGADKKKLHKIEAIDKTIEKSDIPASGNMEVEKKNHQPLIEDVAIKTQTVAPEVQKISNFRQAVEMFKENREMLLYTQLRDKVWLENFTDGEIKLKISDELSREFVARIAACLEKWTGRKWKIIIVSKAKGLSISEQEKAEKEKRIKEVESHPLIMSMLKEFPDAKLVDVR